MPPLRLPIQFDIDLVNDFFRSIDEMLSVPITVLLSRDPSAHSTMIVADSRYKVGLEILSGGMARLDFQHESGKSLRDQLKPSDYLNEKGIALSGGEGDHVVFVYLFFAINRYATEIYEAQDKIPLFKNLSLIYSTDKCPASATIH